MLSYFHKEPSERVTGVEKKKLRAKKGIIRHLFLNGESTCNDIAQHIRLSLPSVQASVNALVNEGVIEDKGQGNSTGGRRPNIYGLQKESFFLLCIDIGRFHVRLSILDSNMKLVSGITTHEIKFQDDISYLDRVCDYAVNLIEKTSIEKNSLVGIGLDMPGVIDSKKGINYSYFFSPGETITQKFEKRLNLPVFLENDANVLALAEFWYGHARGKKNAVVFLLSWGIGLGLIMNGNLHNGSSGFAGEFSHIPVKENGTLCWCNKQGCLETVASATALSSLAKEGTKTGNTSSLFKSIDSNKEYIEPHLIIEAANQGDQFAVKILSEVGFELGKGISIIIQILNPEIIVLGGRMAAADQYIITPIKHALNSYCNPLLTKDLKIEITNLKEEAAVLGCGIAAINGLLTSND
ncbi:MAG: ROK family transcriptional regulator [Bacteroidetes bacterium]|nr:ROK family transcriptional regulator [Bacteroidota bacterium]